MNLNILNAKALERQVKLLEGRINELQTEIDGLEKMKAACHILLGNSVDLPVAATRAPEMVDAPAKKPRKAKSAPKTEDEELADDDTAHVEPVTAETTESLPA